VQLPRSTLPRALLLVGAVVNRMQAALRGRVCGTPVGSRRWFFLVQIEPLDTGDARLLLKDVPAFPCSRRYRQALRDERVVSA